MGQGTSPLWGAGVKPLALRSKYFRLWQSLGSPRGLNAPFRKRVHGDAFPLNQYHSPLGRGSKPLSCPSRGSVGRSIPSRSGSIFYAAIQIRFAGSWLHKKSPPFALTSFSLFIAFTKCALILNQKLSVRPTRFLQNSNLSKHREMCSHSLRSLGYISRLLGSILRPLSHVQISRQFRLSRYLLRYIQPCLSAKSVYSYAE